MPGPGPLDTGSWHGKPQHIPARGQDRPQRQRSCNLAWLWANRMRILVTLATAAGALSLTITGPFRGFPSHACHPNDCTGDCASQLSCLSSGEGGTHPGPSRTAAEIKTEAGIAHAVSHVASVISTEATGANSASGKGAEISTEVSGQGTDITTEAFGISEDVDTGAGKVEAQHAADNGGTDVARRRRGVAPHGKTLPAPKTGTDEPPKKARGKQGAAPHGRNVTEYRTFKLLPPASMSYPDVEWCPAAREPAAEELIPFHPGINVMMILGAQKAGTTWLFNAMTQHPSVHGAEVGFMRGPDWSKEIHYFDRWPLLPAGLWLYADTFPPAKVRKAIKRAEYLLDKQGISVENNPREMVLQAARDIDHRSVFMDASPEYLLHPGAPPRIKQVLPLARFVIVLRDPVARDISAYFMQQRRECERRRKEAAATALLVMNATGDATAADVANATETAAAEVQCIDQPFDEMVEELTATKPEGMPEACWRFREEDHVGAEGTQERMTWQECQQCSFTLFNSTYCSRYLSPEEQVSLKDCNPTRLQLTDYSAYAAQIAWWLAFFPPEQFLILTMDELRDPSRQLQTLNRVLRHAKLPNAAGFTPAMAAAASGFSGNYTKADFTQPVRDGAAVLRRRIQRETADLQDLLDTFWPEMQFSGIPPEL